MSPFQYCPTCGTLQWIEHSERVDKTTVAYRATCGHWFGIYEREQRPIDWGVGTED